MHPSPRRRAVTGRAALVPWLLALAACPPAAVPCSGDGDCASDQLCIDGQCRQVCNSGADCAPGLDCRDGVCRAPREAGSGTDATAGDRSGDDLARTDAPGVDTTPYTTVDGAPTDILIHDVARPDGSGLDGAAPDTGRLDGVSADLVSTDRGSVDSSVAWDVGAPDRSAADSARLDGAAPDLLRPDAVGLDAVLADSQASDQGATDDGSACDGPVDGGWSAWSDPAWVNAGSCGTYAPCKQHQIRTLLRTCTNPPPACGGAACVGSAALDEQRDLDCGLVNGGWSAWSDPAWDNVGSCGTYLACKQRQQRVLLRTCTNPPPACGGAACVGAATQDEQRDLDCGLVNGGWTAWSAWTAWRDVGDCGDVQVCKQQQEQTRTRTCTNPAPACGGLPCEGEDTEGLGRLVDCPSNTSCGLNCACCGGAPTTLGTCDNCGGCGDVCYNPDACSFGECGPACFVAGTQVRMADGSARAIEQVREGERVLGYDEALRRVVAARVTRTFVHASSQVLLRLDAALLVTPEHPFYVQGEWRRAGDLRAGDPLLVRTPAGLLIERPLRSVEQLAGGPPVYNLEVDGVHSYFAGEVLVHNKPPSCPNEPD